jgi:IS30 family transposase
MTRIGTRPVEINAREASRHWEGDPIIGKNHKPTILVTVERQSRFAQMDLLEISEYIPGEHKEFSEHTAMRVYFCHPP